MSDQIKTVLICFRNGKTCRHGPMCEKAKDCNGKER